MILGFIPARGGSKGLPRKNLRVLCGEPLIHWTIRAAQQSGCVDRIVVSTDDEDIKMVACGHGLLIHGRRPRDATDTSNVDDALADFLDIAAKHRKPEADPDVVLRLQPTSPLRSPEDIQAAVALIEGGAQAVVGITEPPVHPYLACHLTPSGRIHPVYDGLMNQPRQNYPEWVVVCGAIYAARTEYWREHRGFFGPETIGQWIPPERAVDIDSEHDLEIAEHLMSKNREPVPPKFVWVSRSAGDTPAPCS